MMTNTLYLPLAERAHPHPAVPGNLRQDRTAGVLARLLQRAEGRPAQTVRETETQNQELRWREWREIPRNPAHPDHHPEDCGSVGERRRDGLAAGSAPGHLRHRDGGRQCRVQGAVIARTSRWRQDYCPWANSPWANFPRVNSLVTFSVLVQQQ